MKKILALVIGIILVVSLLSSCTVTIGSDDKGLDAAYEYVLTMYKDKPTITPSDFDVIAVVTIEGEAFPITWEVEVTKGDANSVKLVKSEDGKTVKVDIDEKVTSSVDYNLTFKIEKNGNACSAGFAHSIPEYKLFSWQQYVDAAEDEDILFFKVDSEDKAIWGELASSCARDNGIKATVIYGSARDLDALLYMDYPVFASNFCPNAGSALGLGTLNETIDVEGTQIAPGDFFFGDETGIVVIPQQLFASVMAQSLLVKIKESGIIEDINSGKTLAEIVGLK